jgi:hypothetical protein
MNEEVYVTGYGYMTPEAINEELEKLSKRYDDDAMMIGLLTVRLHATKQDAIELSVALDNLMKAKAKMETSHEDNR